MDVPYRARPAVSALAGVLAALVAIGAWWFWIRDDGGPVLYAEDNGWAVYDRVGTPFAALSAYDGGCFVGFGGTSVWAAEDDCTTVRTLWTVEAPDLGSPAAFTDGVRLPGGRYAGLLQTTAGAYFAVAGTPGGTWSTTRIPVREPDGRDGRILWDGTNLIVIADDSGEAAAWTSPDGLTWTPHPAPAATVESYRLATDGKGLVVAAVAYREAADAGLKQAMWRSADSGATWTVTTAVPEAEAVTVSELLYDGTRFMAFGERHPAGGNAATSVAFVAASVDGTTWIPDSGLARCGSVSGALVAEGAVVAFTGGARCPASVYALGADGWEERPNPPEGPPDVALALADGRIVGATQGLDRVWVREAVG